MCGIIGYIGKKNAVPILIQGLERLEYRGYDSVGICVKINHHLEVLKRKGKVSQFKKIPELKNLPGNIGIAHTRWATHGEPSRKMLIPTWTVKEK